MVSEKDITLLIVDDNIPVVISMDNFFENKGFRVLSAYNAKEAKAVYFQSKPDVVIMGSRLHHVLVFDLLKELNWPKMIFITSHPEVVVLAKKTNGCIGVAGKPINYFEIYDILRTHFKIQKPMFE